MWPESQETGKPLRTGLTTGCCATACCVAAAHYLLGKEKKLLSCVMVTLPKGRQVELEVFNYTNGVKDNNIQVGTVKDAGDDPDVTHGATVFVELSKKEDTDIRFHAAKGVGTVTREGLALAVGEPAINPIPRKMMTEHLKSIAQEYEYKGGFDVAVGVEDGESIARKTMNARLGILGGLSILGTTGIVRPFSCAAWIASIYQGMNVANANGVKHIAASTGNTSERVIQAYYGLTEIALIEMGDFAGAVLKYMKRMPEKLSIEKLSICGGLGKISKLANGHMDLHSRTSSIDFAQLSKLANDAGADTELIKKIMLANTSIEVLNLCKKAHIPIADILCEKALNQARRFVPSQVQVEVWAIDRQGNFVGKAGVDSWRMS